MAPLSFGQKYIAPLLGEYAKTYPLLEVELILSDSPCWSDYHQWDIVIHIGELRDSSMYCITIAKNKRFVCASPDYLLKNPEPNTPADLKNHSCIVLRENGEDATFWRFTKGNVLHHIRVHPKLASNEGEVVKKWGLLGLGIVIRSEWDVIQSLKNGKLIRILSAYELPNADIVALVGNDASSRSPRTQKFIQLLSQKLGSKPWNDV